MVFILDASTSMGMVNFQKSLDFVTSLVLNLNVETDSRVGLMTFSDNVTIQLRLSDNNSTAAVLNSLQVPHIR